MVRKRRGGRSFIFLGNIAIVLQQMVTVPPRWHGVCEVQQRLYEPQQVLKANARLSCDTCFL